MSMDRLHERGVERLQTECPWCKARTTSTVKKKDTSKKGNTAEKTIKEKPVRRQKSMFGRGKGETQKRKTRRS